jgi:hypothetical protein
MHLLQFHRSINVSSPPHPLPFRWFPTQHRTNQPPQQMATSPVLHHPISHRPQARQQVPQEPANETAIIARHGTIIIEAAVEAASTIVVVAVAVVIGRGGSMDPVVDMSAFFRLFPHFDISPFFLGSFKQSC